MATIPDILVKLERIHQELWDLHSMIANLPVEKSREDRDDDPQNTSARTGGTISGRTTSERE